MNATTSAEKYYVLEVAKDFLEQASRTTLDERRVIIAVFTNRCREDPVGDTHANLDYIRRLLGVTPVEVVKTASGMSSLGFRSSVRDHGGEDVLHLAWASRSTFKDPGIERFSRERGNEVAVNMFVGSLPHLCPGCAESLAEDLDFSPLQSDQPLDS